MKEGTIRSVISKVIWTKKYELHKYKVIIIDRLEKSGVKEYFLSDLKELKSDSLVFFKNYKEVRIPLHRVIALIKNGEVIWRRSAYQI